MANSVVRQLRVIGTVSLLPYQREAIGAAFGVFRRYCNADFDGEVDPAVPLLVMQGIEMPPWTMTGEDACATAHSY